MNTPWTIQDAVPSDAAAFARFAEEIFVSTYADEYANERLDKHVAERFGEAQQYAELCDPARTTLVARDADGAWAGFSVLRLRPAPPEVHGNHPVEVERFYVGGPWQGRGLARSLMEATIARAGANGHEAVWLCVWKHNARARRFYEKMGFAAIGEAVYVFGGEAELDILMARRVDGAAWNTEPPAVGPGRTA